MKSFSDLNNYSNTSVNYNSQLNYTITFGPSSGNVTTTKLEGEKFLVDKQIALVTATGLTRDLLINITSDDPAAIAYVQYQGIDGQISVASDGVDTWSVLGVRSVAQFDDVFANLYVAITPGYIDTFVITVNLNDQMNDPVLSYTITVTSLLNTMFSVPASFTYNEDTLTPVANISITETFIYATNYTISIVPEDTTKAKIAFAPGNVELNSWTTTNTKANINAQLANLIFSPQADFTGNTYIDTTVLRTYNNVNAGKRSNATNAANYADYSAPPGYAWSGNAATSIGINPNSNLAVTDTALNKNYSSTISISPTGMGNLYNANVNIGNTITFTGNKVTVNANIANVTFIGNTSANLSGNVNYVQTQTTDNILQANISIPINYQIPAIHIYSNIAKPFGTRVMENGGTAFPPATANVDFWGYQMNYQQVFSGGKTYLTPYLCGADISLSTIRDTSTFRYNSPSINLKPWYGIISRLDPQMEVQGSAGYFGFWIKQNIDHPHANWCKLVYPGGLSPMYFVSKDGQMYLTPHADDMLLYINYGPNPSIGTWTHIALQVTAGTPGTSGNQIVSAWRDGVPITNFYGNGQAQTGTNWIGRAWVTSRPLNWNFGVGNYPYWNSPGFNTSVGSPVPDFNLDEIIIRNDAPYTNLQSFNPQPVFWGANVRQLVTGI